MTPAAVRVPVATVWSAPSAVRPSDAAAVRDDPDVAAWIAAMTPDEQTSSAVVTQLLLGDPVVVDEVRPDGWARVVAPAQAAPTLDPRGYPGWMRASHLAAPVPAGPGPLVVDALSTTLVDAPTGRPVLPGVGLGTLLTPAGPALGPAPGGASDGAPGGALHGASGGTSGGTPGRASGGARGGWLPVHVPGRPEPLWARTADLAPAPSAPPTGAEALAMARRLLGAVYVWGGLSTLGIDCSGLVHLTWRRLGVRLPRDAHDQAAAAPAVAPGTERPGDLYCFARPGRRVHHVAVVVTPPDGTTPPRILHASTGAHRVVEEPMPPDRAATLTGAHRP
ncbi:C40 family peptidase [Dactylosporangium aurantiacum]|uniref:C40 family peptidase n=2 Tax=Dactylosporangium aurantiacum TaxID=35754 RepID=A0A9Q9MKA6_9ACTN|nr:C40 family peptidase [Dactylosporangium aurantiacum]